MSHVAPAPQANVNPRLTPTIRMLLKVTLFTGVGLMALFYAIMSAIVRDVDFMVHKPFYFAFEVIFVCLGTMAAFSIVFFTRSKPLSSLPIFAGLFVLKIAVLHVLLEVSGTYRVLLDMHMH
jgi:hypothetical protein